MSDAADVRSRIAEGPTETDVAFAKALKKRRSGPEEPAAAPPTDVATPAPVEGESNEMALLRAELAQLRAIVMAQNKAPTNARMQGEVADAELAAEASSAELLLLLQEAEPRAKKGPSNEPIYGGEDLVKIRALREKHAKNTQAVDIARAKAGIIPFTHPGLKRLPPEHPVFRVK